MFEFNFKQKSTLLASFALLASLNMGSAQSATDPVVLTFSTVGDSRQDPSSIDPTISAANSSQIGVGQCQVPSGTGLTSNPGLSGQDCKWLQNTKAWARILQNIQQQKAKMLFFNGDMIMGYGKAGVPVTRTSNGTSETVIANPAVSDVVNSDLMQFYKQYGFWRGMVANLMENGTYVVPVPGNHETQCKRCSKTSQVENENAWRDNMGDLILDTSRFTSLVGSAPQHFDVNNKPGATDSITTDQSQLSYSFDVGTSHFVVINTDPVGRDGYAPSNWLEADLKAAEARGAINKFVFGHKPAFFYGYVGSSPSSTSSLFNKNAVAAETFWDVIVNHNATYFSGHEHIYHVESYPSTTTPSKSAYQVLVGAGGSPFESSTATGTATDRMYSWATVQIYQSGKVVMNTYGFDANMTGSNSSMTSAVQKLATVTLHQ